jgi:hypothetical protein
MFVSLGKTNVTTEDGLEKVQKALLLAIQALVKYEGMLQQFAIDDKGNTSKKKRQDLIYIFRRYFTVCIWSPSTIS